MGRADLGLTAPLRQAITIDQKNPDRYIVVVTQSGLGLPDRDYYLKDDARLCRAARQVRGAHRAHADACGRAEYRRAGEVDPRAGDAHRQAALGRRPSAASATSPTTRARARSSRSWRPGSSVAGVARDRGRGRAAAVRRARARCRAVARASCSCRCPWTRWRSYFRYHFLVSAAHVAAERLRRRALRFLRPHAQRPAAAARALEARAWMRSTATSAKPSVRLYVERYLPAGVEGERCARWWRTCARPTPSA